MHNFSNEFFFLDEMVGDGSPIHVCVHGHPIEGLGGGYIAVVNLNAAPKENDIVLRSIGGKYTIGIYKRILRGGLRLVTNESFQTVEPSPVVGAVIFRLKKTLTNYPAGL